MKVSLKKFEESVQTYISKEICSKLNDWRKWAIPVMVGVATPKMENIFHDKKELLLSSGFIDENENIDIDLLYDKFHKIAEESGSIIQNIPYIGEVTFTSKDIESLYRILKSDSSLIY